LGLPPSAFADCAAPELSFDAEFIVTATGPGATDFVVGDWNEDGRPDLAVARSTGHVTLLMGQGEFRLCPGATIPVAGIPCAIATGDLDLDGNADLAVASTDRVVLLRGDGAGGFVVESEHMGSAVIVEVARLDSNANPDLVIMPAGVERIDLLFLNGFASAGSGSLPFAGHDLAVADFDGDGDQDIVTGRFPGFAVVLNDGTGAFGPMALYDGTNGSSGSSQPDIIAVGDRDGDGILDLAGVDGDPYSCCAGAFGRGDGTFQPQPHGPVSERLQVDGANSGRRSPQEPQHVPPGSHYVTLANLNSDGRAEFIDLNYEDGRELMGRRSLPGIAARAADFDGDGHLDVAVLGGVSVAVHPITPEGWPQSRVACHTGAPFFAALIALDGDAVRDMMIEDDNGLRFARGTSQGGFEQAPWYFDGERPYAFADVDADADNDVIAGNGLYRSHGDGSFDPVSARPWQGADALATGDLNHDGRADVVAAFTSGLGELRVILGSGDGSFRIAQTLVGNAWNVDIVDLDGDSHADVVTRNQDGGHVAYGDGDSTFTPPLQFVAGNVQRFLFGDVDSDGKVDVVTAGAPNDFAGRIFLSRGRTFEERAGGFAGGPSALADLNADGILDLVVSGRDVPLEAFRGSGLATFHQEAGLGPSGRVFVDDRTGDGIPDLVVTRVDDVHQSDGTISIFANTHGDIVTATLVTLVGATVEGDEARLVWSSSEIANIGAELYRSPNGRDWDLLGRVAFDGNGRATYIDRGLAPGRYGYRLRVDSANDPYDSEIAWVEVALPALYLESPRPQPTQGAMLVAFVLPQGGATRLEVFDLQGRREIHRDLGWLNPGRHEIPIGAGLAPGIHSIRLSHGSAHRMTRAVVIR